MLYVKPVAPFIAVWLLLLFSASFTQLSLINGAAQLLLFIFVVCIPAWRTERMSYVDIGWPLGLAVIGVVVIVHHTLTVHSLLIGAIYLFMGLRMGLGAIKMWRSGHLERELPRYQYQRIRWVRRGITNTKVIIQSEVLAQGLANMSFLALPAFIIAIGGGDTMGFFELMGLVIWIAAFVMETVADTQKNKFLKKMRAEGLKRQVCNVGLWKYSRHPNYFAEWMVWNGLIIAAIPSWYALRHTEPLAIWLLLGGCLAMVSRTMYVTLVYYTGAKPAEHFSVQKRPHYLEYQKQTNRFFPGPVKSGNTQ